MRNEKSPKFNVLYLLQTSKFELSIYFFLIISGAISSSVSALKLIDVVQGIVVSDYQKAIRLTILSMLFFLLYCVFSFLSMLLQNKILESSMYFYKSQIAKKIRSQSSSIDQGSFISMLNNDTEQIGAALYNFLGVCECAVWVVVSVASLFSVHYLFAIWAVVFFFLNMLVPKILKKHAEKNEERRSKNLELYLNESSDIIRGFDVWNLYNAKKKMRDKLHDKKKRELDYKGEVLFGGKNLKDLNEFCLFHHMGFMTQKPYVFNDTILNNITLGESYDTSLVKEAVEESRLEDFSDKLEYALSNNGGNISGGQAQRIAIAREVIHDHEVMVFDEAVNALDQRLVREVVNILLEKKATIIFIAHNLDRDMLSEFDEVIDMSKVNECYGESV